MSDNTGCEIKVMSKELKTAEQDCLVQLSTLLHYHSTTGLLLPVLLQMCSISNSVSQQSDIFPVQFGTIDIALVNLSMVI